MIDQDPRLAHFQIWIKEMSLTWETCSVLLILGIYFVLYCEKCLSFTSYVLVC